MKKHFFKPSWITLIFLSGLVFSCSPLDEETNMAKGKRSKAPAETTQSATFLDFDYALASRWAPIHYQDTDVTGSTGLSGKSDYITAITFDNDWIATNNWNDIRYYPATAYCYFSVVETGSHWFILYAFFHPRDWDDSGDTDDEHENDLEGFLSIVQKDGTEFGNLQGIITVAHSDFYSFTPSGSPLQANQETIDGRLTMEYYNGYLRPITAQEAKGHGLKASPYYKINGDGIVYLPSDYYAEQPSNPNDRDVSYQLINIFEWGGLWDQRYNSDLFVKYGTFGKSHGSGNANAPWGWDDHDDGPLRGELATDPAKVAKAYFKNFGYFSTNYYYNRYLGI